MDSSTDNDWMPPFHPVCLPERDMDDLFTAIRTRGLDVLEEEPHLPHSGTAVGEADEIDVSPAPAASRRLHNPVRD